MDDLPQRLRIFKQETKVHGKGALAVVLVITQHAQLMGLPLCSLDLITKEQGQVKGLGKSAVQAILKVHGITRVLAEEGGRTSRGSLNLMRRYVEFLNDLHQLNLADLERIENWWVEQVSIFFKKSDSYSETLPLPSIDSNQISDDLPIGSGIDEDETIEPTTTIGRPFDPTLIRVEREAPTIDLLISRMDHQEINLSPDFQRKGNIWTDGAQSRLIESILIRIPIPAFYVDATDENYWVVIDGLQRLTTLKRFVLDKSLKLSGLEFLKDLDGNGFDDLPRSFQRRIRETQITIFSIQTGTPEAVKFNIFKRINTGGLPLSTQEIRNALNGNQVREFLKKLTESESFKKATLGAINDKRMADRECVTRFLAFTLSPPEDYRTSDFDAFLNDNMKQMDVLSGDQLDDLDNRFQKSMNAAHAIFGKFAFRKYYGPTYRLAPINKAIFESWAVNLGALSSDEITSLINARESVLIKFSELMRQPVFENAVSQGTGDLKKVHIRFGEVKNLILSFIKLP